MKKIQIYAVLGSLLAGGIAGCTPYQQDTGAKNTSTNGLEQVVVTQEKNDDSSALDGITFQKGTEDATEQDQIDLSMKRIYGNKLSEPEKKRLHEYIRNQK